MAYNKSLIPILVTLASLAATPFTAAHVAPLNKEENLLCRVTVMATKMDSVSPDEDMTYICETLNDGMMYSLSLLEKFVKMNPDLDHGDTIISIPGGHIIVSDDNNIPPSIEYPKTANITVADAEPSVRRALNSQYSRSRGVKSVLLVRVTSMDSEVSSSSDTLSARVFGIGGTNAPRRNIVTQFDDCSHRKLRMIPAEGPGIVNGVTEVFLPRYTGRDSVDTYVNDLTRLVAEHRDTFDHVMYCIPENSHMNGNTFLAFAFLRHSSSYYHDAWCGSLSAYMHEVGHNIGLHHAGRPGRSEYADVSGYMGFSNLAIGYPSMCYNAYNKWAMGWFDERRRLELDGSQQWSGYLDAFTDYDEAEDSVVLVKVGDHYLHYNRANKFNSDTQFAANQVTIVTAASNGLTTLVGTMRVGGGGSIFTIDDFLGSGHAMMIQVCDIDGGESGGRITMSVHLDDGKQQSLCTFASPSNGPSSSLRPSIRASLAPSTAPSSSTAPSLLPSEAPSEQPSVSTSPSYVRSATPSNRPSTSLRPSVSMSPSVAPSVLLMSSGSTSTNGGFAVFLTCILSAVLGGFVL